MIVIYLANLTSVGIFGMVLSAAFCDIVWTRKKLLILTGGMAAILMLQGIVYFFKDVGFVWRVYPIITHVPLTVLLCALNNKQCLWPAISVLTAYLCCQIRRWLVLAAIAVFSGGAMMQNVMELCITLPMLFLILRFVAPSVRSVSGYKNSVQWLFGAVPLLYYGFDYLTRVYTNLVMEGGQVAVEFMPFVCCLSYLAFVAYSSAEERKRSRLEQTQESLYLQVEQAVREIEVMRSSQQKTSTYRHDLRHHMQYLSSCIENGRLEQAQGYIHEICSEIEANKVTVFCENEAMNLILSSFAGRVKDYGISIKIRAGIRSDVSVLESDLCVLLSNALENALHACQKQKERGLSADIDVSACEEKGKLFLQITNSCDTDIMFDNGIPITGDPGHGLGIRSICAIVERYSGMYSFFIENGRFYLRVVL